MNQQLEMEAVNRCILDRRRAIRGLPPYRAALIPEITQILTEYFAYEAPGSSVSKVKRVGGGASKEQFFVTLPRDKVSEPFLLRMDLLPGHYRNRSRARVRAAEGDAGYCAGARSGLGRCYPHAFSAASRHHAGGQRRHQAERREALVAQSMTRLKNWSWPQLLTAMRRVKPRSTALSSMLNTPGHKKTANGAHPSVSTLCNRLVNDARLYGAP